MKICILGAGSLGCAMGGLLTLAGHDVWLVNHNRQHVEAMRSRGLVMRIDGKDSTVAVNAALNCAEVDTTRAAIDLIVVLVKSFDTATAIAQALPLLASHTTVLTLQNGMGHERILGEAAGAARVISGKSYVGGQLFAPGQVIVGAKGKETIIGEPDGTLSPRVLAIAQAFTEAGLTTQASDNILGVSWDKLLVNVATGALCAISGLPYGEMYPMAEIEAIGVAAAREAMTVAQAQGARLSFTDPREAWLKAGAGLPFEFKASMLQSLEKGTRTEIDFVNGAVVRAGRELGIATPVNSTLVACLHGIEKRIELAASTRRE